MELLNELYISKSFVWLGNGLDNCFDCKYCRARPKQNYKEWNVLPTQINPHFINLPVVINLFYGDPLLQVENTKRYLRLLEQTNHKAPVVIITKGDLRQLGDLNYNLNLHIALSTIGKYSWVDKVGYNNFLNNLKYISTQYINNNIKFSCEFRPIMYGINDDYETIDNLFKICSEYNLPVGYGGLQGDKDLVKYWEENNINLNPFPNYEFSVKKPISIECQNIINKCSQKYNVPTFSKTSCLLSYSHDMDRDYNAHYYRPNELNCKSCIMKEKCFKFKEHQSCNTDIIKDIIPFEFNIEEKEKHTCILHNSCKYPSNDCTNISGKLINIKNKITLADVRVIKWLTGYTVAADFEDSNYLSKEWET